MGNGRRLGARFVRPHARSLVESTGLPNDVSARGPAAGSLPGLNCREGPEAMLLTQSLHRLLDEADAKPPADVIAGMARASSTEHQNVDRMAHTAVAEAPSANQTYRPMPKSSSRLAAGVRKSGSRPVGAQSSWARWWAGRLIQSFVR